MPQQRTLSHCHPLLHRLGRYLPQHPPPATHSRHHLLLGLQTFTVGRDLKCVYSNGVPAASLEPLRRYLTRDLGFARTASKSSATLHLIKKAGYTSMVVSYNRRPG